MTYPTSHYALKLDTLGEVVIWVRQIRSSDFWDARTGAVIYFLCILTMGMRKAAAIRAFFFSPRIWQESRQAGQRTRQFCWFATALPCDLEQVFSLFSHSASPPAVCLIYLNGSPDEQGISHLAVLSSMWPRLPWDCCTAKPASFTTNLKHLYKILIDCFFFSGSSLCFGSAAIPIKELWCGITNAFWKDFWSGTEQGWPHWGCWTALLLGASQIRSHAGVYQWGWGAPNAGCEWKCAQGSCEKPNELEQVWVIQICHACPLDNGASLLYQCTVASNIHLVEDLHVWHLLLCVRNSIKWKSPQGQAFLRSLWHVACRHLCAGNLCCPWGCLLSQGLHLMGSTAGKLCIPPTSTVLSAGWNGVIFWALNHDFWMEVMFCSGIWNVLHLLLTLA